MTRWFALGLILVGCNGLTAQTADMIKEVMGSVDQRPLRPNPFGGGLVQLPQLMINAQPPAAPNLKGQNQPVPPNQPQPRRSLRSATIPAGPAKFDQHGDP